MAGVDGQASASAAQNGAGKRPVARLEDSVWDLRRDKRTQQLFYEQAVRFLMREGGKHWSCRHPDIVAEIVKLWRYPDQPSVKFLQKTLADQVSECFPCVLAFNQARRAAQKSLEAEPSDETQPPVEGLEISKALDGWDVMRLTSQLDRGMSSILGQKFVGGDQAMRAVLTAYVEVLLRPSLLSDEKLCEAFTTSMSALLEKEQDLSISGGQWLVGVYFLCAHGNDRIRGWARRQVRQMGVVEQQSRFAELEPILDKLINEAQACAVRTFDTGSRDDESMSLTQGKALSVEEKEIWTGILAVQRQLHASVVRDHFLPRYPEFLPLVVTCVVDGGNALFPAAQCLLQLLKSLSSSFWQLCSFDAQFFRRLLIELACSKSLPIPVRKVSLELLEEVVYSTEHVHRDLHHSLTHNVLTFLCQGGEGADRRPFPPADTAVSSAALRTTVRILAWRMEHGGARALPLQSCPVWAPKVVGSACSPGLAEALVSPAIELVEAIVRAQTQQLARHLRRARAGAAPQPAASQRATPERSAERARGEPGGAAELPGGAQEGGGDSEVWCESVWGWLLGKAGARCIPMALHVAILEAARELCFWQQAADPALPVGSAGGWECGHTQAGAQVLAALTRFESLVMAHVQQVLRDEALVRALAAEQAFQEMCLELVSVPHREMRDALAQLVQRGFATVSGGVPSALQKALSIDPRTAAAGLRSAFRRCEDDAMPVGEVGVVRLVLLYASQLMPAALLPLSDDDQLATLRAAWGLSEAFIRSRKRLRAMVLSGERLSASVLDGAAAAFFRFFKGAWARLSRLHVSFEEEDDDVIMEGESVKTLAECHGEWLASLGRWGGVASVVVRRHWCECVVEVLGGLRQRRIALDDRERQVFATLMERRDLFTDEQVLALSRELAPLGVGQLGNLGKGFLDDLPSSGGARRADGTAATVDSEKGRQDDVKETEARKAQAAKAEERAERKAEVRAERKPGEDKTEPRKRARGEGKTAADSEAAGHVKQGDIPPTVLSHSDLPPSLRAAEAAGKVSQGPLFGKRARERSASDGTDKAHRQAKAGEEQEKRSRRPFSAGEESRRPFAADDAASARAKPSRDEGRSKAGREDSRPKPGREDSRPKQAREESRKPPDREENRVKAGRDESSGSVKKSKRERAAGASSSAKATAKGGAGAAPKSKPAEKPVEEEGYVTVTIGGMTMKIPIVNGGGQSSGARETDVMGKVTRRKERTAAELETELRDIVLAWDLPSRCRPALGELCDVPAKFDSLDHYEDVLSPLLLLECWQQAVSAFDEEGAAVWENSSVEVSARAADQSVDSLFVALAPNGDDWGGVNVGGKDSGLQERDLVLVWVGDGASSAGRDSGREANGGRRSWEGADANLGRAHAVGIVERGRAGDVSAKTVRLRVLARGNPRLSRLAEGLQLAALAGGKGYGGSRRGEREGGDGGGAAGGEGGGRVYVMRLFYNLATIEREYVALHSVRSLSGHVQRAILDPLGSAQASAHASEAARAAAEQRLWPLDPERFNAKQLDAVGKCVATPSFFSLIQGPPGTGKTTTLVGLLTVLLLSGKGKRDERDAADRRVGGQGGQGGEGAGSEGRGQRVLLCAPSNAAVDEVAMRLKNGLAVRGRSERYLPKIVRIGAKGQMRADVWEAVGLERMVEKRVAKEEAEDARARKEGQQGMQQLEAEVESLTEKMSRGGGDGNAELVARRRAAMKELSSLKGKEGQDKARRQERMRRLRTQLLEQAQVVCATLSGAGGYAMKEGFAEGSLGPRFDVVIVDEAAQALEPSVLIPLRLGAPRCILVGDPQQLPATVFSRLAESKLYARSLFERLQLGGQEAQLLSVQYRMHPAIRAFPSAHFYSDRLTDGFASAPTQAWHADIRFPPLVFYDLRSDDQSRGGGSRYNEAEAALCAAILRALARRVAGGAEEVGRRAAVMTPYRRQVAEIGRRLRTEGLGAVEVSTVDSFQGREMDIGLLSCVRGGVGHGIGFVADIRRMNVALTRAKCSLIVVGDAAALSQSEHWRALVEHARQQKMLVKVRQADVRDLFGSEQESQWLRDSWPEERLGAPRREKHG